MNDPYSNPAPQHQRTFFGLHPLIAAAAIAILALCGVGIATMLMNRSDASIPAAQVAAGTPAVVAPATIVPPPVPAPVASAPEPAPTMSAPKPLVRKTPAHQMLADNSRNDAAPIYNSAPPPAVCRECGVVQSLREIKEEGHGSGLGAVAGGVVGGLLGNQVGGGRGKALATVAGALGGGYAGNSIEKSTKSSVEYQLVVRYEDGTTQPFTRATPWPYEAGDHVRVVDNQVLRN